MPTIKDLGKLYKDKFPGKYDLSDEEVGRIVKAKFPGEYDDFEDTSKLITAFKPRPLSNWALKSAIQSIDTGSKLEVNPKLEENIQKLIDLYRPNRGRFTSWLQKGKSEGREKFLQAVNSEQIALIEQGAILEQAVIDGRKRAVEFNAFVAEKALLLLELEAHSKILEASTNIGMPIQQYAEIRKEELFSNIRLNEIEQKSRIEIEARWQSIVQDLNAADMVEYSERQVIKKLRDELIQARRDRYAIEAGDDPPQLKAAILEDFDIYIDRLRKQTDAREARLLLSENGQED